MLGNNTYQQQCIVHVPNASDLLDCITPCGGALRTQKLKFSLLQKFSEVLFQLLL